MARVFDFCNEGITSFATGVITLSDTADTGFQTLQSVLSDGEIVIATVYLDTPNGDVNDWEVAIWDYAGAGTLTRNTTYASSNSDAAIAITSTHKVRISINAAHIDSVRSGWPNTHYYSAGPSAGNDTVTGIDNTCVGYLAGSSLAAGQENTLFGAEAGNALSSGDLNTFVGKDAGKGATTGNRNTIVGKDAYGGTTTHTGSNNVIMGAFAGDALSSGGDNTFIGDGSGGAVSTGLRNIAIGSAAMPAGNGNRNIALGYDVNPGSFEETILLGYRTDATANNQCIIGSSDSQGFISNIYFNGAVDTVPVDITMQGCGGLGSDVVGADFNLSSGRSTGDAIAGALNFQTSDAGAAGTTLQTLSTKGFVDGTDGGLVWGNPTGGSQGAGTINAVGVYDDSVALSDYVFEIYYTGSAIDLGYETYSTLSLPDVISHTETKKSLRTMPSREDFKNARYSNGEMINHLWETVETQFIYITELNSRINALES